MKRVFKIKEIRPNIFLFEFKDHYDMCMHFLRYQEYYESPSPKFRGKAFTIFEFMKWYSAAFGKGAFTYPIDWSGFNIPDNIIEELQDIIPDRNTYDDVMYEAWKECKAESDKFYIIGIVKDNGSLNHEIAHGLFYLNDVYRKQMTALVKKLDPQILKTINSGLKELGYTPQVYIDESQAYMSTGLLPVFKELDQWKEERKPFQKLFKEFSQVKNGKV